MPHDVDYNTYVNILEIAPRTRIHLIGMLFFATLCGCGSNDSPLVTTSECTAPDKLYVNDFLFPAEEQECDFACGCKVGTRSNDAEYTCACVREKWWNPYSCPVGFDRMRFCDGSVEITLHCNEDPIEPEEIDCADTGKSCRCFDMDNCGCQQ